MYERKALEEGTRGRLPGKDINGVGMRLNMQNDRIGKNIRVMSKPTLVSPCELAERNKDRFIFILHLTFHE